MSSELLRYDPMKKIILLISFTLLTISLAGAAGQPENHEGTREYLLRTADYFSTVAREVKPAVVYIQVKRKSARESGAGDATKDSPFADLYDKEQRDSGRDSFFTDDTSFASGSGFLINREGYILTNNHVVERAVEITVTLADRTSHRARVIGTDKATDVGLLKIDGESGSLPSLVLGDSDRLKTGEWVLAFGLPYEFIQTVTAGIVSATGRSSIGVSDYESFIQTDAAINQGNSGGPLVDINGRVVGINTAYLTQTGGYTGIGFAIPVNIARKVAEQLMENGKVVRAWLGVGLRDARPDQLRAQSLTTATRAALVVKTVQGSPAEKAGLRKDDLITALGGTPVAGAADFRNRVSLSAPGEEVSIEYYRDGVKSVARATLGELQE